MRPGMERSWWRLNKLLLLLLAGWTWRVILAQSCSDPPAIGNAYVTSIGPYSDGEAATYTCQQGYSMNGDADAVTCSSGSWVGTRPVCSSSGGGSNDGTAMWVLVGLGCVLLILMLVALIFGMIWCCCWTERAPSSRAVHHSADNETTRHVYSSKNSTTRPGQTRTYHTVRVKSTGMQTGPQLDKESTTVVVNPYWRFADSATQTNRSVNIDNASQNDSKKLKKDTKDHWNKTTQNSGEDSRETSANGHSVGSRHQRNGPTRGDANHIRTKDKATLANEEVGRQGVKNTNQGLRSPPETSKNNRYSSEQTGRSSTDNSKALIPLNDDESSGNKHQKDAKQVEGWMPHSKPIRNFNTSTK